jgi:molybdate transport system ATP-binding protein
MTTPSIKLTNVSVNQYGKTVLEGVSFAVSGNQHLAITGASGSGKTILAKILAGQIFHQGTVEINYTGNLLLQQKVAIVGHSDVLKNLSNTSDFYYQQRFNSSDASDAVTLEEELNRTDSPLASPEKNRAIDYWLKQLEITHRKKASLIQLSNGEQKKLQLIKSLLQQSQILILDKPYTGLDTNSRNILHNIINQQAAKGVTIILISDNSELTACITHIAKLENGKLINFIPREDFSSFREPSIKTRHFSTKSIPVMPTRQHFQVIVKMKGVNVSYGDTRILQNINWEIKNKERWLLQGPNGAGKSTLLSLITGDNPQAYANEIYLFDQHRGRGESIWEIKHKIGYVSPELHKYFDPTTKVEEAIASGFFDTMGLFRPINSVQQNLVNEWMNYFELSGFANRPLSWLSAGQQRWVLLARALIKNPPLLVLDEPCQGLDEEHLQQFIQLIDTICSQSDTTLIYVSHYNNEIPGCITKKIELYQGKQVSKTKPQDVIAAINI